jgi:octaprenyl-diphosphate synthase
VEANNLQTDTVFKSTKQLLNSYLQNLSGLKQIEELIASKFRSDASLLTMISKYLLDLGGKRIRPALCLIIAKALGQAKPTQDLLDVSAGIELIHMATLLHDDIIDKSTLRRHKDSPLKQFGQNETLLAGDFLLVRAFSLCAHLDEYIIQRTEEACVELTEGEILETPLFIENHTKESSLNIAKKKTAALFRLASQSAAHIAKNDSEVTEICSQFGENLGIAFQVLDDILDVISDEETLGKKPGSDLFERKPSIVNILWLSTGSTLSKTLLRKPEGDESLFVQNALSEIKTSNVINEAKVIAKNYASNSLQALEELSKRNLIRDTSAFNTLQGLVAYCLSRME